MDTHIQDIQKIGNHLVDFFHYLALFGIGATIVWSAVHDYQQMMQSGYATLEDILLLFIYLELGTMVGIYFIQTTGAYGFSKDGGYEDQAASYGKRKYGRPFDLMHKNKNELLKMSTFPIEACPYTQARHSGMDCRNPGYMDV